MTLTGHPVPCKDYPQTSKQMSLDGSSLSPGNACSVSYKPSLMQAEHTQTVWLALRIERRTREVVLLNAFFAKAEAQQCANKCRSYDRSPLKDEDYLWVARAYILDHSLISSETAAASPQL
jgi:hypothetical protein